MFDFSFTDEQKELYQKVVTFAKLELDHDILRLDRKQLFAKEAWKKCGTLKLQGLLIDKKYGGAGLHAVSTTHALEALGYGCDDNGLNFSIAAHMLACAWPISQYGSFEQKEKYLGALSNGSLIAANAMTEPTSGSDAFALKTSAKKQGKSYVLNGAKTFVTNGPVADVLVLYALTDLEKGFHGGLSAFIMDVPASGLSFSAPISKLGLRTSPMCQITLDNVIVHEENRLAKEGAGAAIFSAAMLRERALLGALHIGTMKKITEMCVTFCKAKYTHEIPQGIAFLLANMSVKTEAARLQVYKAAYEIDANVANKNLSASMAKIAASESVLEVCQMAMQIMGAEGYVEENNVERYLRDTTAAVIYSGTTFMQKNILAGWLGL